MIGTIKQQWKDFREEVFDRVEWPNKAQVLSSVWQVVALSVFVGAFLWLCDWVLAKGFAQILHK